VAPGVPKLTAGFAPLKTGNVSVREHPLEPVTVNTKLKKPIEVYK
jgi:hypothetical protein